MQTDDRALRGRHLFRDPAIQGLPAVGPDFDDARCLNARRLEEVVARPTPREEVADVRRFFAPGAYDRLADEYLGAIPMGHEHALSLELVALGDQETLRRKADVTNRERIPHELRFCDAERQEQHHDETDPA